VNTILESISAKKFYSCFAGFYEGVRPPKRQEDSPEQQDNIDDVDSVMAKSEDVK